MTIAKTYLSNILSLSLKFYLNASPHGVDRWLARVFSTSTFLLSICADKMTHIVCQIKQLIADDERGS